jgi:hypothetical protein
VGVSEETVFRPVDLPADGADAVFFADLNVVGVRRGHSCEEARRAVDDLQARWRRQHLRLIDGAAAHRPTGGRGVPLYDESGSRPRLA